MQPEEFVSFKQYGNKEVFARRVGEGYDKVAFGSGKWVGTDKIIGLFAFFDSTGKIGKVATLQHRTYDDGRKSWRGDPLEREYADEKKFNRYRIDMRVRMGGRRNLVEVIEMLDAAD